MTTHMKPEQPLIQPYLFFSGRCEEALHFYADALGAKTGMLMRFRESPEPPPPGVTPADWDDKIMHAEFSVGDTVIMASDGCEPDGGFGGFSLSLTVTEAGEADRVFQALAEGGQVTMPMGGTFFAEKFGMVKDRFGVGWMIHFGSREPD